MRAAKSETLSGLHAAQQLWDKFTRHVLVVRMILGDLYEMLKSLRIPHHTCCMVTIQPQLTSTSVRASRIAIVNPRALA